MSRAIGAILPRVRRATLVFGLAWLAVATPAVAATVKRTGARTYEVTVSGAPQSDLTIARLDFRLGEQAVTHRPVCRPTPCDPRMGIACPLAGMAIVCAQPATRR
jgi:hypothetical protein